MIDLADKRIGLGLDYPHSLEWRDWVPGREYHKILYVKNNIYRTQVVHWSQPACKHFWTSYSEPVRLNGLVTAVIGVVFKPRKLELYETAIEFSTAKETFSVILRGIPPTVHLSIPDHLDLGYVPVNDFVERRFLMRNLGDTVLTTTWEVDLPFTLSPVKAVLNPGDCVTATARFGPKKAAPYEASAVCLLGSYPSLKLKLEGVAKHTFLVLSQTLVNFGQLLLGNERVLYLRVTNKAAVPSFYRVKRPDAPLDDSSCEFLVEPAEGTIAAGSTIYLKVTYRPTVAGTSPLEHFDLVVPQMSPVSLTCTGAVLRPSVKINSFAISFGSVASGSYSSRSITLKNRTDLPVLYQFMPDDMGVFEFVHSNGVIAPRSTVMLTARFKPIEPFNYYVRVVCIVQNQYPYYCDFLGTCYRDDVRASTLMSCHVDRHRQVLSAWRDVLSMETGAWVLDKVPTNEEAGPEPPKAQDETGSDVSEWGSDLFADIFQGLDVPSGNRQNSIRESFTTVLPDAPVRSKKSLMGDDVWNEYFHGSMVGWDPVTVDVKHLDFGGCTYSESASVSRTITVQNKNTTSPVTCLWVVREPSLHTVKPNGVSVDSDFTEVLYLESFQPPFQVTPPLAKIGAGKVFTFNVLYKPNQENLYFFKRLACFVYEIRDYRDDYEHIPPPWTTYVTAFGHSYPDNAWEVRPEASFSSKTVIFPPALKGTAVYQTIMLRNHRCTALRFVFQESDLPPQFAVAPSEGVIPANNFQLVSFRFQADVLGRYTGRVCCKLNHSMTHELEVFMVATSHIPQIEISGGSNILFKPSSIGTPENLSVVITNVSGIHVQYEFCIPLEYADILSITPSSGVLRGREKQEVVFTFSPLQQRHYSFQVPCSYAACTESAYYQDHRVVVRSCPSTRASYLTLDIEGEGLIGVITVEPQRADLGMLVVGEQYEQRLTLYNSTLGLLDYSLSCSSSAVLDDKYSCTFDHPTGTIQARSYQDIMATFQLKNRINYRLEIECKTLAPTAEEHLVKQKALGVSTTCIATAVASFPSLAVAGIRSERQSAAQLWSRLHIDELNVLLAEPPKTMESPYKYLFCLGKPLHEFRPFTFRFVAQNVGRTPSLIHLVLQCRVPLQVKWRIRLWNDTEVDMESWVEEGDPSEEEKRLMEIWRKQLFVVEPRRGTLEPGEEVNVRFTYHHKQEGIHVFPAILEIEKGCSVQLELSGKTYPFSQKILGLQTENFTLAPVAVGDLNPPIQTFELRNDGYMELAYQLDVGPLKQIEQENYGFPVLFCLNPRGWIAPAESIMLNWLFQPLEPKVYGAQLSFYVEGGKKIDFSIQGMGFKSSKNRSSLRYSQQRSPFGKAFTWYGLPARLSTEFLDLGRTSELKLEQRLVSVRNVSEEYEISFNWRKSMAAEFMIYGKFEVVPQCGTVRPLKEALCKLRFRAGIQPQSFLTTLYCDIAVVKEPPPPWKPPPSPPPPEEVIDKDGVRLGVGIYNKQFQHFPAVTRLPEGMRGKLPHFKPIPLSPIPPPPSVLVPPDQVLFLTVAADIITRERFHSTTERVLKAFISYEEDEDRPLDESSTCMVIEMVGTVLMEMMQECLYDEARDKDTKSFREFDDNRTVYFEEFQVAEGKEQQKAAAGPISSSSLSEEEAFAVKSPDLAEQLLEGLLFDIVKEICDSTG